MRLSASLVLFNNSPDEYGAAIESFLNGCDGTLYIIDNSSKPLHNPLFFHPRVRYSHAGRNLGFGSAHNLAFSKLCPVAEFHLLLNPDIEFGENVLPTLLNYMEQNTTVGALMPRVNYPDGSLQRLCKLLPSPVDLIFRRFIPSRNLRNRINRRYEIHDLPQDRPSIVPNLSGCFLLLRTNILLSIGGFDERYFMYMEDVDLVRRIGDTASTVYFPMVAVVHGYAKGSYKSKRLLGFHLRSAVLYFAKWGWMLDKDRRDRNTKALQSIAQAET